MRADFKFFTQQMSTSSFAFNWQRVDLTKNEAMVCHSCIHVFIQSLIFTFQSFHLLFTQQELQNAESGNFIVHESEDPAAFATLTMVANNSLHSFDIIQEPSRGEL